MNFRKNGPRVEPSVTPVIDMKNLSQQIENDPEILSYAPPGVREPDGVPSDEPAVRHIAAFVEVPTKEIDEMMKAGRAEWEELERTAQLVRDLYVKYTDRLTKDVKRLREGTRLSMVALNTLREECLKLNVDSVVEEAKKED